MSSKKTNRRFRHSQDLSAEALVKEEGGYAVHKDSSEASQHSSIINYQISDIPPLLVVVGATASGKTSAAIDLAKKINGEIICADSRTVYKQMDISTAKPTKEEQKQIKHHLIDVIEPSEKFSAAEFKRMAEKCIQDISTRGKIPIVVGGSGLYIDALLYNFQFKDKPNEAYRTQLLQMNDEELTTLLHTKNIDTTNLNTKNRRHVIRAIETNGKSSKKDKLRENTIILGLNLDREVIKFRIKKRVEQMFYDGFLDEVKSISQVYGWENESMSGVGYKVVRDYFEGKSSEDEVKNAFIKRDIALAKRQRTWFKRNKDIEWFDSPDKLEKRAINFVNKSKQ